MEGKRSITSRSRSHDQPGCAEEWIATPKTKNSEPDPASTASGEAYRNQSLGPRPPLPPRSTKHIEFSKSPVTVYSPSVKQASLPRSIPQTHSPRLSAKSRLRSIATPTSTNPQSLLTKSPKERLQKPQTPPKPHVSTLEFTQGPKRISNHEAEMQDVTSDLPEVLQQNHNKAQHMKKDDFSVSLVTQPRKQRKQRIQKKSDDYEAEMKSFMQTCDVICGIIKSLRSKYGECIVPESQWQIVEQTMSVLKEKDICISVFGQHNCGKSTFLNALIGEDILPVLALSETSIKVKIQHDRDIHTGVCPLNCPQRLHKCCPRLVVLKGKEQRTEVSGPHNIYPFLQRRNKEFRRSQSTLPAESFTVTLKVNIPLLSGSVPPGWTVSIVDNPGFGEAKEHVTQLAEASMVTSSAYIYLIQTENVGGREAADFFKELQKMDKSAIADGRLTIGVTKFDTNYDSAKIRKKTAVTAEMVKERVTESIEDATGAMVSDDMIIPLCGEWALAGSKLASSLINDPNHDKDERYRDAATVLQSFPYLSVSGGQGQSYVDTIMALYLPEDLVQKIESISGVSDLKARISYVVGKACIKMWATKIHAQLQTSLYGVKKIIKEIGIKKERTYRKKCEDLFNDRVLLTEIRGTRESIRTTIVRGKDRTSSALWKSFELHYAKDIEKSKPQEAGKDKARTLIVGFRESCKRKIENRQLGPREFEASLKEFLEESETKLQTVFDSACGFWNSQGFLLNQIEYRINDIASMKVTAGKLLNTTIDLSSAGNDQVQDSERSHRCKSIMTPPKLGDIKLKVQIPGVSLPWWKKLVHFFRGLLGQSEIKANGSTGEECRGSTTHCSSASAGNDYDAEISDIYDETWLESTVIVNEHRSNGADEHKEPKPSKIYKSWTYDLEETVNKVQIYMEEACDQYFKEIEPRAVKYFYKEYCLKTRDYLNEFDTEFDEKLGAENERQKKLRKEIDNMTKELKELKKAKDKLSGLEKQLCDAYANFTIEHAKHIERESQQRQERSHHENFELAREEVERMNVEAEIRTELESL